MKFRRTWLLAAAFVAATSVHAQTASSGAKKDLVARIVKVQQPGIEAIAQRLVEQPAGDLLGAAGNAIAQRVPKERQDAVARDVQSDVQKFVQDTVPQVQQRAIALAPTTIGPLLEERFTEDELRQILAFMEAPVYAKFQNMGNDFQRVLVEKLVADTRPVVEPKMRALDETIAKRLGLTGAAAAPSGAASGTKKR